MTTEKTNKVIKIQDKCNGMLSAEYKISGKNITFHRGFSTADNKYKWIVFFDGEDENAQEEDCTQTFDYFREAREYALSL